MSFETFPWLRVSFSDKLTSHEEISLRSDYSVTLEGYRYKVYHLRTFRG